MAFNSYRMDETAYTLIRGVPHEMPLLVFDIPSKCRFDLMQVTLDQVRRGRSVSYLAKAIGQHTRHAHLLLQNAYILGFVRREGNKWTLTASGFKFLEATKEKKGLMLAKAMLESRLMSFVIKRAGSLSKATMMTTRQISDLLIETTVVQAGSKKRIEKTTADRRAVSVKGWISWLERNIPKIGGENARELLVVQQKALDF